MLFVVKKQTNETYTNHKTNDNEQKQNLNTSTNLSVLKNLQKI